MTRASEPQLPERAAWNQDRFRKLNERIGPHNRGHQWVDPPMPDWVCECASQECMAPVQLSVAEYESVRGDATRFFVAPSDDHVIPDVERVVERHERYWIVEKVGDAGEMSEALDQQVRVAGATAASADQADWNVGAPRL